MHSIILSPSNGLLRKQIAPAFIARERMLVAAHLNFDQQVMMALRKVKAPVVPA
jgi:hypothetical protein